MARTLRLGDVGVAVREMQGLLNSRLGRHAVVPDGRFGPRTEACVRDFQKDVGLTADGIVGPRTWDALHAVSTIPVCFVVDPVDTSQLQAFFANLGRMAFSAPPLRGTASLPAPARGPVAPVAAKKSDYKNYYRISYDGYSGQSYVIKDYLRLNLHAIRLVGGVEIRGPSESLEGFKNECAQFVQYFGVPRTTHWRRGPRVCDFKIGELPAGTVVATLRDNKYYSDYSGRSHVGIYLGHDDYDTYLSGKTPSAGLYLFDQYNGARIQRRKKEYATEADKEGGKSKKAWTDSAGTARQRRVSWIADGEEYYVLLTES